jgi:hypothetical protein
MQAGQILISRWGYDQTNVDFHKVVSVTKSVLRTVKSCDWIGDYVQLSSWGRVARPWDGNAAVATDSRHGH